MGEETYELRLEPEGFQIIPVGADQLAVQGVGDVNTGGQIVTILPDTLASATDEVRNSKTFQTPLFLHTEEPQSLVPPAGGGVHFLDATNKSEPPDDDQNSDNLVIQYGESWFHDFVCSLKGIEDNLMDFPVFCCDGIFWSNRLILASLGNFLTDLLTEDSCLILPDFTKEEFKTFHEHLFSNSSISSVDMLCVCKVGGVFGFNYFSGIHYDVSTNEVNYQNIFEKHHVEYFSKVYGNSKIANHVLKVVERPKRTKISAFLNDVLFDSNEKSKIITCEDCGRKFEEESHYQFHTKTVHGLIEKPLVKQFPCKYCDKTFSYLINVQKHIYLVHPNAHESQEEEVNANVETITNGTPEKTNERNEQYDLNQKADFPELEKFKCKICGEFLKSKRYLVAHIQSHYGGGYKCDYPGCTAIFRENAKLNRHKLVHTGVKAFKCEFCQQTFSLRHNLKMHEKTHTRTDLQKCRFCPYETIQKSNMRLHEATHSKASGKPKGRPAGRQNKGIAKGLEKPLDANEKSLLIKQTSSQEPPDEIEQFIAEMEKDHQGM